MESTSPSSGPSVAKWVLGIVVVLIIVWIGYSRIGNNPPVAPGTAEAKTIKIGVVAPLTAGGSVFGNSFVDSIKLALADATTTKNKYELVIEDDGTNPTQSVSAAQKLVNIDHVQALLVTTSGTGKATAPVAAAAKIPLVCVCTDTTVGDGVYTFTNLILPQTEATRWVAEAKAHGATSVAIIAQNHPGYNALTNAVIPELAKQGIKMTFDERFEGKQTDFRTTIAKAKATNPDLYFIPSFPPALEILGQQLTDAGVKKMSSTASFGSSAKPQVFEGLWYTDAGMADASFQDRFEKVYPDVRFNVRTGPYGYDSFMMVVQGFEQGADVAKYLSSLTWFDGKAGHITKPTGGGNWDTTAKLYVIKNGKAHLAE